MSRSQLTPSTLRARSVQPPSAASSNRLLYWLLGLMLLYASAWCLTQLFQRAVAPIAVTYHRFGIAAALCALFLLIRYTFKHMYGLVPLIITQRLCRLRQGSADDGEQHRAPQQQAVAHTADKFAPPPLASGSSELQTKLSRPQERSKQGEQHCSCSSIHAVLKSDTGASGGSLACRLPATVAEPSSSFKVKACVLEPASSSSSSNSSSSEAIVPQKPPSAAANVNPAAAAAAAAAGDGSSGQPRSVVTVTNAGKVPSQQLDKRFVYETPLVHSTVAIKIKSHGGAEPGDLAPLRLAHIVQNTAQRMHQLPLISVRDAVCIPGCTLFLGTIMGLRPPAYPLSLQQQQQQQQGLQAAVPAYAGGIWHIPTRRTIGDSSSSSSSSSFSAQRDQAVAVPSPGCLVVDTYSDFVTAVDTGTLQSSIELLMQQQQQRQEEDAEEDINALPLLPLHCPQSCAVAEWGSTCTFHLSQPQVVGVSAQQQQQQYNGAAGGSSSGSGSLLQPLSGVDRVPWRARIVVEVGSVALRDEIMMLQPAAADDEPGLLRWSLQLQLPAQHADISSSSSSGSSTGGSTCSSRSSSDDEVQQSQACTVYVLPAEGIGSVSEQHSPSNSSSSSSSGGGQATSNTRYAAATASNVAAESASPLAVITMLLLPSDAARELSTWVEQQQRSQQQITPLLHDMAVVLNAAGNIESVAQATGSAAATEDAAAAGGIWTTGSFPGAAAAAAANDDSGFQESHWQLAAVVAPHAQQFLQACGLHCCCALIAAAHSRLLSSPQLAAAAAAAAAAGSDHSVAQASPLLGSGTGGSVTPAYTTAAAADGAAADAAAAAADAATVGAALANAASANAADADAGTHGPDKQASTGSSNCSNSSDSSDFWDQPVKVGHSGGQQQRHGLAQQQQQHQQGGGRGWGFALKGALIGWRGQDRHLEERYMSQYAVSLVQVFLMATNTIAYGIYAIRNMMMAFSDTTPALVRIPLILSSVCEAVVAFATLRLLIRPPLTRTGHCIWVLATACLAPFILCCSYFTRLGFKKSVRWAMMASNTTGVSPTMFSVWLVMLRLLMHQLPPPWLWADLLAVLWLLVPSVIAGWPKWFWGSAGYSSNTCDNIPLNSSASNMCNPGPGVEHAVEYFDPTTVNAMMFSMFGTVFEVPGWVIIIMAVVVASASVVWLEARKRLVFLAHAHVAQHSAG